jgi:hypothetical protein
VSEQWDIDKLKRLARRQRQMESLMKAVAEAQAEVDAEDGPVEEAGDAPPTIVRRGPGRPKWTAKAFHAAYREAFDRCDSGATDKEIAAQMNRELVTFQRLVRKFGRPF